MPARKQNSGGKDQKQTRVQKTRQRIELARRRLACGLLGTLIDHVRIVECEGKDDDPLMACVDPTQGIVWVNPHKRQELGEPEWTFVIAHQLMHLGLGHKHIASPELDQLTWSAACEHAVDNLLNSFKIGRAPFDYVLDTTLAGLREDQICDLLDGDKHVRAQFKTFAGPGRPDVVQRPVVAQERVYYRGSLQKPRTDWENLLSDGIREAVEDAVRRTSSTFLDAEEAKTKAWRPGELARRWVMGNLPLLGAVASHMKIVADSTLCERMDIPVAAVDAYISEIYFNPAVGLTQPEVLFVYVHELLHAALLHHSRVRGRDPWLWNIACDFVINDWVLDMGIGQIPKIGMLYDPRLKGMSSDEVYDLLYSQPARSKGLRGYRGGLGDVLLDTAGRRVYRGDAGTLDDFYRRCMARGVALIGRGTVPLGLIEEIQSLFTPPVPWDVELARWMEEHVPMVRDSMRSYARASRRQSSTPDIPRPGRYVPQEWKDACTFGVVMDTSGSMDRELLGRALGAIASYAEARDVPQVRLVLCDALPYDRGFLAPTDLRGIFPVQGRGGTVLQPAISFLQRQADFPTGAPLMIITDGWCEEELFVDRDHCFVLPRKYEKQGNDMPLRTSAPIFRVLKEEYWA